MITNTQLLEAWVAPGFPVSRAKQKVVSLPSLSCYCWRNAIGNYVLHAVCTMGDEVKSAETRFSARSEDELRVRSLCWIHETLVRWTWAAERKRREE